MKDIIAIIFEKLLPWSVKNKLMSIKRKRDYNLWKKNGCPVPPPCIVKQEVISQYQQTYGYNILIETGTYKGDMVEAQKTRFGKIISIELCRPLFEKATKRFKKDNNVSIVYGDSGKILPEILPDIQQPVIFWLDGHYSEGVTAKGDKETPILEELNAIFELSPFRHVILIDDARLFIGDDNYLDIKDLIYFIKVRNKEYSVEIKHDIICCTLPK